MLNLLSKLKLQCHQNGIELMNSQINGNAIKLSCCVNGRRDTELNAYIIPDGDSFNFYTMSPNGDKSPEIKLAEEQIIPTLISKVNPEKDPYEVDGIEVTQTTEDLIDEVTIEVEDGVFDTKTVSHNTYKNSRFAYSTKYHKMGTIVEIVTRQKNSDLSVNNILKDIPKEILDKFKNLNSKYKDGINKPQPQVMPLILKSGKDIKLLTDINVSRGTPFGTILTSSEYGSYLVSNQNLITAFSQDTYIDLISGNIAIFEYNEPLNSVKFMDTKPKNIVYVNDLMDK